MTHPILYSFRRCPYAIRARLSILGSGLVIELREVSLANKPSEMITASPKATIPVMVLSDGTVLDESLDIMAYALGLNDPHDWLAPATPVAMEHVHLVDNVFKNHLDHYKYPDRYEGDHLAHRDAALAILSNFDAILSRQAFLAGEHMSLVDAAIFPFVRQFDAVDPVWFAAQPIPAVQAWLKNQLSSPLFDASMVTLPAWKTGDPVTLFGAKVGLASRD
jgi:glutathione S-transferase